jgi:hypothetical protein
VLDPKVESVRASEDWTGVSFVLLDFTDKNEGALLKAADEAGIGPAIRRATLDGIRTGQLILMDIAAQEEMSRIGKGTSVKDMAERIRLARDEVSLACGTGSRVGQSDLGPTAMALKTDTQKGTI